MINSSIRCDIEAKERLENQLYLEGFGCKVYSENDEDGIIAEIFRRIGTTNKVFAETELRRGGCNNIEYLALGGWTGFCCVPEKMYSGVMCYFDYAVNNGSMALYKGRTVPPDLSGTVDYLSMDNLAKCPNIECWIKTLRPRVVSIRYNAKFPPDFEWICPGDAPDTWDGTDRFGASLKTLEKIMGINGYRLVGTSYAGTTAFFVEYSLTGSHFVSPATSESLYNPFRPGCFADGCRSIRFAACSEAYISDPFDGRGADTDVVFGYGFIADDKGYELVGNKGIISLKCREYIPKSVIMDIYSQQSITIYIGVSGTEPLEYTLNPGDNKVYAALTGEFIKNDIIHLDIIKDSSGAITLSGQLGYNVI